MGRSSFSCVNDHSISRVTISPLRSYIGFPRLHCNNNRWIQTRRKPISLRSSCIGWYLFKSHALRTFGREKVGWITVWHVGFFALHLGLRLRISRFWQVQQIVIVVSISPRLGGMPSGLNWRRLRCFFGPSYSWSSRYPTFIVLFNKKNTIKLHLNFSNMNVTRSDSPFPCECL